MNLNSLPDELLAGIFKYSRYEDISVCRKLDSRIDRVARKYDIGTKITIDKVRLTFGQDHSSIGFHMNKNLLKYLELPNQNEDKETNIKLRKGEEYEKFEAFLSKIQISEYLRVILSHATFEGDLLYMLSHQKDCLRKLQILDYNDLAANRFFKKENVILFLKTYPRLKNFTLFGRIEQSEICSYEVFGGRRFNRLCLKNKTLDAREEHAPATVKMDKMFLNKVVRNCNQFDLSGLDNLVTFTFMDVVDLVEVCLQDVQFFQHQKWDFPLSLLGNLTEAEALDRASGIYGVTVQTEKSVEDWRYNWLVITIPSKPDVRIRIFFDSRN